MSRTWGSSRARWTQPWPPWTSCRCALVCIAASTPLLDHAVVSRRCDVVQITAVMDKFEKQFEALDVHAGMLDASMAGATTLSAPEDQIESLIRQVRAAPRECYASRLTSMDGRWPMRTAWTLPPSSAPSPLPPTPSLLVCPSPCAVVPEVTRTAAASVGTKLSTKDEDELSRRLAQLRN